mgnify:FL=1
MLQAIGFIVTALGFAGLALGLAAIARRQTAAPLLALALGVHAVWAATPFLLPGPGYVVADFAHLTVWAAFFFGLGRGVRAGAAPAWTIALGTLLAFAAVTVLARTTGWLDPGWLTLGRAAAAVAALVAAASAYRSAHEEARWHLRLLVLPATALFAYDLFAFASDLAGFDTGAVLQGSRGLISAVALPVIAAGVIRGRLWRADLEISHQAAVYSTALIISGVYFAAVAALTYGLPSLFGRVGVEVQVTVLFAMTVLLMAVLSAGRTRARLRHFVARHFLQRKYDYRQEWRAFMDTIAGHDRRLPIGQRIVMACANPMESPGGALWQFEDDRPRLQATWNFRASRVNASALAPTLFATREPDAPLPLFQATDLDDETVDPTAVWLVFPLLHDGGAVGFVALAPPRAPHAVTWEDRELLELLARQCGHYLVEQHALRQLEESRQFDRFNRQYAFVVHDMKNVVSHLAAMMHNAERHWDNPDFRSDFHDSVRESLDRMNRLIERVSAIRSGGAETPNEEGATAVAAVLSERATAAEERRQANVACQITPRGEAAHVSLPEPRLTSIIDHLLANAIDAAGPQGRVEISVDADAHWVGIYVADDGPGMSADYVATRLFRPFASSKRSGMGLGTYQVRETAREVGGDVEAITSEGSGTTMRVRLPAVPGGSGESATTPGAAA